ncbi:MAG TPA: DUF2231 domain-containing protein [Ktedonobacteraceae bacterium]|nr:DUF2231 domain-containing protein [Ktedonobacteraceae bacterium]
MQHKIKPMGHPVHPMLVVYPLGLLTLSPIFDIVHWITGNGYWSTVAFWMIAAGTLGGLLAAVTGTIDWLDIPAGTRAKTVGLVHGAGNYLVLVLFIVSWLTRLNAQANPPIIAYVLSFLGAALFMGTGYLGGELTLHFGVGIEPGANVNASSPFARSAAGAPEAVSKEPVVS